MCEDIPLAPPGPMPTPRRSLWGPLVPDAPSVPKKEGDDSSSFLPPALSLKGFIPSPRYI